MDLRQSSIGKDPLILGRLFCTAGGVINGDSIPMGAESWWDLDQTMVVRVCGSVTDHSSCTPCRKYRR